MHLQVKKLNVDIFALNPQQIPAPSLPSKRGELPIPLGNVLFQKFISPQPKIWDQATMNIPIVK